MNDGADNAPPAPATDPGSGAPPPPSPAPKATRRWGFFRWLARYDGTLLFVTILLAFFIQQSVNHRDRTLIQAEGSRAVLNETYHVFSMLARDAGLDSLDDDETGILLRNLRFLHYSRDGQIRAARACISILIEQVESYGTSPAFRVPRPILSGELVSAEVRLEGQLNYLKASIDTWEADYRHFFWRIKSLLGSDPSRHFDPCFP